MRIFSTPFLHQNRLLWLDFLRVAAVALVVLRHTLDRPFLHTHGASIGASCLVMAAAGFGWSGVALFFCISGYIVGGPLCVAIRRGRFSCRDFLVDRAFRLVPAAAVAAAVALYLDGALTPTLWLCTMFAQNYLGGSMPSTGQFWSLAVEWHFYLLAPLTIAALVRHPPTRSVLFAAIASFELARLGAGLIPLRFEMFSTYTASHWQVDYFVAGAALYLAGPQSNERRSPLWLIGVALAYVAAAAMLAWAVGDPVANQARAWLGVGMLLALALSVGAIIAARSCNSRASGTFSLAPVRLLAMLSYSIYLTHLAVMQHSGAIYSALHSILGAAPNAELAAMFAYTFAASTVCALALNVAVERPALRARAWVRRRRAVLRAEAVLAQVRD